MMIKAEPSACGGHYSSVEPCDHREPAGRKPVNCSAETLSVIVNNLIKMKFTIETESI